MSQMFRERLKEPWGLWEKHWWKMLQQQILQLRIFKGRQDLQEFRSQSLDNYEIASPIDRSPNVSTKIREVKRKKLQSRTAFPPDTVKKDCFKFLGKNFDDNFSSECSEFRSGKCILLFGKILKFRNYEVEIRSFFWKKHYSFFSH